MGWGRTLEGLILLFGMQRTTLFRAARWGKQRKQIAQPFWTLHQSVLLLLVLISLPGYEVGAGWINAGHIFTYGQLCLYYFCKLVHI